MLGRKVNPMTNFMAIDAMDKAYEKENARLREDINKLGQKFDLLKETMDLNRGADIKSRMDNVDLLLRNLADGVVELKARQVATQEKRDTVINVKGGSSSSIGRDVQGDVAQTIKHNE